mgnify:CR=1 FL=1|jgi:hypothetical protein
MAIYPIKVLSSDGKETRYIPAEEALELFAGDMYKVSKEQRTKVWTGEWREGTVDQHPLKRGHHNKQKAQREATHKITCQYRFCGIEKMMISEKAKYCSLDCQRKEAGRKAKDLKQSRRGKQ